MFALYMNLNYSINTIPSHHSTYNFFADAAMFLHVKITLYFNFEREGLCLQTFDTRANINFGPPCRDDAMTLKKKNCPGETGFLIYKRDTSVVKNIPHSRDGINFTCDRKSIF